MKLYKRYRIKSWVKIVLPFYLFTFLPFFLFTFIPLPVASQGLPLIRNYMAAEYGGHNRNYDIEIGEDGTVFVANFEGLLYYDRARWRMIHAPELRRVTVVYRDKKNTIWVGGFNFIARLQKRPNGELYLQQISGKDTFKGEVIEIFEEGASVQFVVSDNNIYEIEKAAIPTVKFKKHLNTKLLTGVESDIISLEALKTSAEDAFLRDTTLTVNLDSDLQVKVKKGSGLIVCDGQGRKLYTINEANGLCSNHVSYVAYDGHGVLWGATANGIFAIELPSIYSYFLPKDGMTGRALTITAFNGKIYVGDTNGLFVVEDWQYKPVAEIDNICWTLCLGRDGLMAATSSGIYRIAADGRVSRLTSNATTALLVDGDKVYAGEPDGVHLYQTGKNSKINGLPLVTEISKDARGNLWFRNVHGETAHIGDYKAPADTSQISSPLLTPFKDVKIKVRYLYDDHLWIGGDEMLAVIDMGRKDLTKLTDRHHVRFCSIVMGNDSVLWGGYGDRPQELQRLGSDERHLHFFYALDYAPLTGKTHYRYRLDNNNLFGTKGQWSAWTDRQDVEFLNLPYGSFTLSVQAQLANGELSEVATVDFSIAYPLLMRWYMVVLYFLAFAFMIYLLFRYRLKRLEKEKVKLERIVEERTADLRNAQDELIRQEKMATVGKLTKGLVDRILNPMNYIINYSKMSNDLLGDLKENIDHNKEQIDKNDYEDTLDVLDMLTKNLTSVHQFGQNTTRILKAMEEVLRDRTGGYGDITLLPVLQQVEKQFAKHHAQEQEQYGIRPVFDLPADPMPLYGNPDMLCKAVTNLLDNAAYAVVKKIQKDPQFVPEISLAVSIAEGKYSLKVRDNGTGIEEKNLGQIYDPFFTTKTTGEAAGVGLYLTREIIQNHGGDVSVASVQDEYTEFIITLPKVKK
jgi:signal transduction histidine kinase/ligand-binding sensor domain-containing protein